MKTLILMLVLTLGITISASGQDSLKIVVAKSHFVELYIEHRPSGKYMASFYTDNHSERFDLAVVDDQVILWDAVEPGLSIMGLVQPERVFNRKLLLIECFRLLGFRIIDVTMTVSSNFFVYLLERQI